MCGRSLACLRTRVGGKEHCVNIELVATEAKVKWRKKGRYGRLPGLLQIN